MPRIASPKRVRIDARVRRTALVAGATLILASVFAASAAGASRCGKTYSYAGFVSARAGHGISATLEALSAPRVRWGHVAGWVGVGGPGAGPNGETEWIQVGFSGFYGGASKLYYEVTLPGRSPRYTELDAEIHPGESHRIGVVEMRARPNVWRVWVDGRPVTGGFYLPGSHGRWQPMATAESWNAGMGACNGFAYRFSRVKVATRSGGWRGFAPGYELEDPGYAVWRTAAGFVAAARS